VSLVAVGRHGHAQGPCNCRSLFVRYESSPRCLLRSLTAPASPQQEHRWSCPIAYQLAAAATCGEVLRLMRAARHVTHAHLVARAGRTISADEIARSERGKRPLAFWPHVTTGAYPRQPRARQDLRAPTLHHHAYTMEGERPDDGQ
jgi:hypothetical protein